MADESTLSQETGVESSWTSDALQQLLAPVGVTQFLSEYWANKPLHLRGAAKPLVPLLGRAALDSILASLSHAQRLDGKEPLIRVSFPHDKWIAQGMSGTRPQVVAQPGQVAAFLAAGATIDISEVQRVHAGICALTASAKCTLMHAGDAHASYWLSTCETGVTRHFDPSSVLVLQIEGRKRWKLSMRRVLPWPSRAGYALPDGTINYVDPVREEWEYETVDLGADEFVELTVEPGDLLFFPAGTFHETRSVGSEMSVGLHLAFDDTGCWRLLEEALLPRLRARPEWRHIPAFPVGEYSGSLSTAVASFFRSRLKELVAAVDQLTDDELNAAWQSRIASSERLSAKKVTAKPEPLQRQDRLRCRPDAPMTYAESKQPDRESFTIFCGDEQICFDEPELFGFARALYEQRDGFVAENAMGWRAPSGLPLSWERVHPLLSALLEGGILVNDEPDR
jgi:hypothetical protein